MVKKSKRAKTPVKKSAKTQQRKSLKIDQPILPTKKRGESPLAHLTLIHVRLIGVQAKLDIREGQIPDKANVQAQVGVGSGADNTIHVDAVMRILGRPQDAGDDEASSIEMNIHYQCVYRPEGVSAESLKNKAEELATPAMLVMWPHIRELVMSITGRMAIPPLILPMFTVGATDGGKGASVRMEDIRVKNGKG